MTAICEEEGLNVNVIDINNLLEVDDVRMDVERDEDVSKYENPHENAITAIIGHF